MAMSIVNMLFCAAIVTLGYFAYRKGKAQWPLYIATAFGLFCISHLSIIFGFKESVVNLSIAVRILAYLLVIAALFKER